MNVDKGKILRIAIIAVLSFSVMIGGQLLYTRYSVEKSLINSLSEKSYVNNVDLIKDAKTLVLSIGLMDVTDISSVWNEIHDIANQYLHGRDFSVDVLGNPDDIIEGIYHEEIQFPLYEAIQTGSFMKMKSSFDDIMAKEGITIKVFLDSKRLFLHIQKGEHYIYKIVELS